ncbi:MAG: NRDE family protein [Planctomycetota bacterium]
MCTVTIIPQDRGCRVVMSRDEAPGRPMGLPPRVVELGGRQVLMPIDAPTGGTWIGVSDAGYAAALLNHYPGPVTEMAPTAPDQISRGGIIPAVMSAPTLLDALDRAMQLPAERYADFRLLLFDQHRVAEIINEDAKITLRWNPIRGQPWLAGSALLGDAVAERPRRKLMRHALGADRKLWPALQDTLHRQACTNHTDLAVWVKGAGVRTVSITTAWWSDEGMVMSYHGLDPDRPAIDSDHRLTFGQPASAKCAGACGS